MKMEDAVNEAKRKIDEHEIGLMYYDIGYIRGYTKNDTDPQIKDALRRFEKLLVSYVNIHRSTHETK